ncbi:hypothetical protein [Psychroserpens mesophilus]|uniref:hypothetical protein n=1 Tax=Psychroserpens mesophilus TaxID=325473 RepID=UPI003D656737
MKELLQISVLILITFVFIISCQKDDEINDSSNVLPNKVIGHIILPQDSNLNVNSLTVLSSSAESIVSEAAFELDVFGDYTSLYVTNTNNEVVLIGYKYPQAGNNDITSTTTALALIMMSPTLLDISEQAKLNMINNILSDDNFNTLVTEIEQVLIEGGTLFDQSNNSLINAVTEIYESSSNRSAQEQNELPVDMNNAGRNFIFNNSVKAYSTVIGVYDGNTRIEKIVVEGVQIVPNSVNQLNTGEGGSIGNPIDYNYTLPEEDGDYTFKFRTGKPGSDDGSVEHDEAFYENLGNFSYNLLNTLIPGLNVSTCKTTIINNCNNLIQNATGINGNESIGTILYTVADITIGSLDSMINNCADVVYLEQGWFHKFLGQWNFINTAFGVISNGANTTIYGVQWGLSEPLEDRCFNVLGNTVTECVPIFDYEGQWYMLWYNDVYNPYNEALITLDANGESTSVLLSGTPGSTNYEDITDSWSYTMTYNASSNTLNLTNNFWSVTNSFPVTNINDTIFYANDSSFSIELHRLD